MLKVVLKDNSGTDLRPLSRFLNKPSFPVTVSDFAKQREQNSESIPSDS